MSDLGRADVEAIKATLCDPYSVCFMLGLPYKRIGLSAYIRCLMHNEKHGSCSITGVNGTLRVNCFGCDFKGDIFHLIAAVERLDVDSDFPSVLEIAARHAGITLSDTTPRPLLGYVPPRLPPPVTIQRTPVGPPPLDDVTFSELVAPLFWTGALDNSAMPAEVVAYLRSRGLLELAIADGWAALPAPEYQGQVIASMVDAHGEDIVARSGLVYIHEEFGPNFGSFVHEEARLIIPWRNSRGQIATIQRRRLDTRKDRPKYVFATGRSPVEPYGIERLASAPSNAIIVFCEGATDNLALRELRRQMGGNEVVLGIPGLGAWIKNAPTWVKIAKGRTVAVAIDNDGVGKASDKALGSMMADLANAGAIDVQEWIPEGAKDWAQVLLNTMMQEGEVE